MPSEFTYDDPITYGSPFLTYDGESDGFVNARRTPPVTGTGTGIGGSVGGQGGSGVNGLGNNNPDFTYNSYSGADIVAQIVVPGEGPMTIGELQTISYSTHRENTPVRILGRANPGGHVKGPRTIAGSMIFTVFDKYAFYRLKMFQGAVGEGIYPLADMLPPFDIVISFANEYGRFSKMKIEGITIVDEGQTMSVDDLVTEQTYMYMARGIIPMVQYDPEQGGLKSRPQGIGDRDVGGFFDGIPGGITRF